MPQVEFDSEARAEFDEAIQWYAKRSPSAAIGLIAEVNASLERIAADPLRFPKTFAECQRCALQKYPFNIVYYHDADRIVVVALAHFKRRPEYWRSRL